MGWLQDEGNKISNWFSPGIPGRDNYKGQSFQNAPGEGYDPGAFQGQWNSGTGAFSLNGLAGQANGAQGMRAPGFNQSQAGMGGLASMLMNQATGQGPSLAQEQLKQATQTNVGNSMAMAAQTRGENPSMQGYQASQQAGNLNQQAAGQGVQAGIQERLGAMGQLNGVYGQMGQQGMQQQQLNNQMQQYFTSQGMSAEQAQLQAQIAQQQMLSGAYEQNQGLLAGASQQNAQAGANFTGGVLGALGSVGGSVMNSIGLSSGGVTGYPGMSGGGIASGAFQGLGILGADIAGQPPPAQPQQQGGGSGGGGGGLMSKLGGGGAPAGAGAGGALTGEESAATAGAAGAGSAAAGAAADAPLLMMLADKGTIVPGVDRGVDERPYMLRPDEVVTPPESPMHPYIKAAQQDPAYAAGLAFHLMRAGIHAPTGPSGGYAVHAPTGPSGGHGNMAGVGSGRVGYDINAGGAG